VFRDETLGELVREALVGNYNLQIAAARVEQSRYLAGVARAPLFPQLGVEADGARGKNTFIATPSPGASGGDTDWSYLAAAELAWEIDVWGRIRRASEAARADLLADEAFRRGVVLSLVTGVAQAWFELRELALELEIARQSVESFQETRQLFERQYRGGVTSKLDVLSAEAALAQALADVPRLEQAIVEKENELSVLLGREPGAIPGGAVLDAQWNPPEVPAGVPAELLQRRPDLIEAEHRLVAANARVGEAFTGFFPRVDLTALAGSVSPELAAWGLGARLLGPLFTFGRTTYTWRASQAADDQASLAYRGAVLQALREVSDALVARDKLAIVRAEQERAVAALRESVGMARARYLGGLSTYLEVLTAQQQLYPAEYQLARTKRDQLLAVVRLYRALGGGWNEMVELPEPPSPLAP
jgi:multidrug efflux system outer membrane protein